MVEAVVERVGGGMDKRQRWEYCDVDLAGLITYYLTTGDQSRFPSQGLPPDFPQDSFGRMRHAVAWLGESGWEAYGMIGTPSQLGRIFLKRPIE